MCSLASNTFSVFSLSLITFIEPHISTYVLQPPPIDHNKENLSITYRLWGTGEDFQYVYINSTSVGNFPFFYKAGFSSLNICLVQWPALFDFWTVKGLLMCATGPLKLLDVGWEGWKHESPPEDQDGVYHQYSNFVKMYSRLFGNPS